MDSAVLAAALTVIRGTILILMGAHAAAAGDPMVGKASAPLCAGCHGHRGEGKVVGPEAIPSIARQHEAYLVRSMRMYKTGERKEKVMNEIFGRLSDEEIAGLAAYYAGMKQRL